MIQIRPIERMHQPLEADGLQVCQRQIEMNLARNLEQTAQDAIVVKLG